MFVCMEHLNISLNFCPSQCYDVFLRHPDVLLVFTSFRSPKCLTGGQVYFSLSVKVLLESEQFCIYNYERKTLMLSCKINLEFYGHKYDVPCRKQFHCSSMVKTRRAIDLYALLQTNLPGIATPYTFASSTNGKEVITLATSPVDTFSDFHLEQ